MKSEDLINMFKEEHYNYYSKPPKSHVRREILDHYKAGKLTKDECKILKYFIVHGRDIPYSLEEFKLFVKEWYGWCRGIEDKPH